MSYFMRLVDRESRGSCEVLELGVHSSMNLEDVRECIHRHFNAAYGIHRRVVGVFDDKMRIFYPLSFLLRSPRTFSNREQDLFSVVYEDSSFMNEMSKAAPSADDQEVRTNDDYDDEIDLNYVSETSNDTESLRGCGKSAGPSRVFNDTFLSNLPVEFVDAHLKMILDEVASRTMLRRYTISQVFHALSLYANASDHISEEAFLGSISYMDMLDPSEEGTVERGYSTYERMYNAIKEFSIRDDDDNEENDDESGQNINLSIYRISLFMSLFCSNGDDENDQAASLKIIYNLFDFNRDGFVTLSDAHNCFYMLIKSMLNLFPDVIFDIEEYPIEKVVSVLTESLFRGKVLGNGGNTILQFPYFQQWYHSRDQMIFLLVEAVPNPLMLQGRTSQAASFQEARRDLGLEGISPLTLMQCLNHYASERGGVEAEAGMPYEGREEEEFQFISRRGVFASILLASKMESANNVFSADWQGLYNAEVIVCQLFALYDISQAGYVDRNDIYAGLSAFCGETFSHRVQTMFTFSESTALSKSQQIVYVSNGCSSFQTLVTRSQMIEYLLAVLKAVLLFGDHDLEDITIQSLAVRMISDALAQKILPVQLNGSVAIKAFASWLEVVINIKNQDATSDSVGEERTASVQSSSGGSYEDKDEEEEEEDFQSLESQSVEATTVAQELQAVKRMMGFTGFTAEDVLDLLGEVSREGMISEFNWFQAVSNMCAFNALEGEDRMDEALLFAEKIFHSLAALYPAIVSDTNERLVNYSLLLSAVTILCDSPVEDKMFTAFMMLSDSTMGIHPDSNLNEPDEVSTFASMSNVIDYFRGVFSLLCAVSPTVQELATRMKVTPDAMAMATLQCTMAQNGLHHMPDRGFDIDQFSSLAWTCIDM